ncbi:MAG TPA: DUF6496 domain-containing protein [Candidatus Acidoferrales bacterium]|nr:DUF6496 domain-containing protein [Candidatus Acidoferrales bacterium]
MRKPNRAVAGLRSQSRRSKARRRANPKLVGSSSTSRTRTRRKLRKEEQQANVTRGRRRTASSSSERAGNARKSASRRAGTTGRSKYGPRTRKIVGKEMHEFKQGQLKSGGRRKVTNPKQAIAIGLSEARRAGAKVPPPKKKAA